MWFDNDLFRLAYLPTIILPLLFSLFSNDLTVIQILPDIIGWSFILISGNLVNDYVDQDRKLPLGKKGLLILAVVFLLFGLSLLLHVLPFVLAFAILGVLYNFKLKGIRFLDAMILVFMFLLPYFSISLSIGWYFVMVFLLVGLIAILVDKCSDEEKYKKTIKQTKIVIMILTSVLILFVIFLMSLDVLYTYMLPIIPISLIILWGTYHEYFGKSTKILGIYSSCVILFYVIAILTKMGKLI